MAKQAKVVVKNGRMSPNGREKVAQVRSGEKGTGKVLGEVIFWPWSAPSCEQADVIIGEIAQRQGVELVAEEAE